MTARCKSPRIVPFPTRGAVTTLADVAKAQAQKIGRRIRERRDELELTQKELAARMTASPGADAQQVSNWERGIHKPSDDNLEILAEALETDMADLVSGPLSERKPKGDTPDLAAALNGDRPPELAKLQEQLEAVDAKLDLIIAYFDIEADEDGHPQLTYGDVYEAAPKPPEPEAPGETEDAT